MNKPPYAELIAAAVLRPESLSKWRLECQTIPAFTVYYLPSTSAHLDPALATLPRARLAVEKKTLPTCALSLQTTKTPGGEIFV
jgi:hypothetical protein